jgi:hypothetical protein
LRKIFSESKLNKVLKTVKTEKKYNTCILIGCIKILRWKRELVNILFVEMGISGKVKGTYIFDGNLLWLFFV